MHRYNKFYYHSWQFFFPFHWLRAHHMTCKQLPTNNGLLMRNVIQLCLLQIIFCSYVKKTMLFSFLQKLWQIASLAEDIFFKKQTRWSNDKTIIELGYCKYHDLSVSRRSILCLSLWLRQKINLLPTDKPNFLKSIVNALWRPFLCL